MIEFKLTNKKKRSSLSDNKSIAEIIYLICSEKKLKTIMHAIDEQYLSTADYL